MNKKVNKTNTGRRRASVIMFITFTMLIPSGIMMHLFDSPGLEESKHHAMMLHNLCALIFVTAGRISYKIQFNSYKKIFLRNIKWFCSKIYI